MEIVMMPAAQLRPYEQNAKTHPQSQIDNIAESLRVFGFKQPLVVDGDGVIVAGHGRYLAACQLGVDLLPCVVADDLTPEQVRAYRILDNKIAESPWDDCMLALELPELDLSGFDLAFELPAAAEPAALDLEPDAPAADRGDASPVTHCPKCGFAFAVPR